MCILGCGSALPTMRHYASSQVVEVRNKLFLVDCGEGTQMQLRRSHVKFMRINHILISHLHGDHCLGLIGMLSTFGMLGRTAPMHIYATAELGPVIESDMKVFCSGLDYEICFHPIDTKANTVIYEDRSLTVETIPLDHRGPCCGFLFREKPTRPHIRRDIIDMYGIPLSQIDNIKSGHDWVTDDGEVIPNSRLTCPADKPRSYAYCSDTRYMPELHRLIKGVSVLYHESTYGSDNMKMAEKYKHSTAEEAARTAKAADAGMLILGHYSARYEDENVLLVEAKKVFENTVLAEEMAVFDV